MAEELQSLTDVVQLPAIRRANGSIQLFPPEILNKADISALDQFAKMLDGEVVYFKMRAIYTKLETDLCQKKDCWRPTAINGWCRDHSNE